jgi:predicted N-acetyltransferase YhbS
MVTIRQELAADAAAREALLDAAYGPARFAKPSQRLRAGRKPANGLSFVAVEDGAIVATLRLWDVSAGLGPPALLLGPLAVHPDRWCRGIGSALMRHALNEASRRGHSTVLLVGDAAYYGRFGFSAERTGRLWLPGLDAPHRLLGCELIVGALAGARGRIDEPKFPVKRPVAERSHRQPALAPQAA